MGNIIRSQLYRILTDKLFYVIAVFLLWINFDEVMGMKNVIENGVTGGNWLNFGSLSYIGVMAFLLVDVQCRERKDKIINYDILSGAGRNKVFLGRYFSAIIVTAAFYIIFGLLPVIAVAAVNGWGDELIPSAIPARAAVFFFTTFCLSTEITLIAVVIKKELYAIAACFGIWSVEMLAVEKLEPPIVIRCLFSAFENAFSFYVDEYEEVAIDGSVIGYIEYYLPTLEVWLNVGYSVVIGAVCLTAAMKIFRRRDFD